MSKQAHVTWNATPTATTYSVYRATVSGGPYVQLITGTGNTFYDDPTIVAGTTYYYAVAGVNGVGEGPKSAEFTFVTPNVPAAPTGLTVTYIP